MDDIVLLLRVYGKRYTANAIDSSLMLQAADEIERYRKKEEERRKMDVSLKQKLKEDREAMYDAMCHIGVNNEIWQDRIIYAICKSIHDIITKIEKEAGNEGK